MEIAQTKKSPSRAKPGRPRSEEKRAAILHAAGCLFLDKGLDRTSMDAVAQEAGVSKQTVYSHFSSKEDLLEACIRSKLDAYELRDDEDLRQAGLREGLVTLCTRLMSLLYDDNAVRMQRTATGSANTHPEIASLFFYAGPKAAQDTVVAFLERHREAGHLVLGDVREAADMLCGSLSGQVHLRRLLGVSSGLDEQARLSRAQRCVDMFLSCYGTEE